MTNTAVVFVARLGLQGTSTGAPPRGCGYCGGRCRRGTLSFLVVGGHGVALEAVDETVAVESKSTPGVSVSGSVRRFSESSEDAAGTATQLLLAPYQFKLLRIRAKVSGTDDSKGRGGQNASGQR